jgi:pyruvate/2-oxoglutarate dehydrogenase complex dihydrolipoamide acyltransferase (E2) component
MVEITFPVMSANDPAAQGVIATWYVRDGETVAADQIIAEVQMDKVDAEVLAPGAGVVRLIAPAEVAIAQGSVIARLE